MTERTDGEWRLGVDIGGTFTDVVLWQVGSPSMLREKLLTTPEDPARAVLDGIGRALDRGGIRAADLDRVIHGTTLVANALIERKGVRTALFTTRGFRDVLEIGREWRYDLFNLDIEMPRPLVPRPLRFEIDERVDAHGNVVQALDAASVDAAISAAREAGVESVGVCLLHAYGNARHEQRIGEALAQAMPEVAVSLSSAVSPELGEYERTSTTVANAYVHPIFEGYVQRLVSALKALGFGRELLLVLSDGRLVRAEVATRFPVRLVQSGPAAGAEAARMFGQRAGTPDVLCFDMGGTTAKACLVPDGQPDRTVHFEVARETRFAAGSGLPLQIPAIDMIEIGAGGGSIARIDARGLLQVGPDSAGAAPGPACYGLGNALPTVTDCDLLLGYLDAGSFLGGQMTLDREAAETAVRRHLAEPLGIGTTEAAWGVHETVTANMAQAATIHAIERAMDVSRFALLPIGGAGPVHACAMASKMGIRRLICPPGAGVASAIGMLCSAISFEIAHAAPSPLEDLDLAHQLETVNAMQAEAAALVTGAGVDARSVTQRLSAMLRYVGQGYEIETEIELDWLRRGDLAAVAKAFAAAYRRRYGREESMAVQLLSWRVAVEGPRSQLGPAGATPDATPAPQRKARRPVWFEDAFVDTPVFHREAFQPGHALPGPAIVEETESTLVLPPDFHLEVDDAANLVLTRTASAPGQ
jgi:N-methylhydantoinase A